MKILLIALMLALAPGAFCEPVKVADTEVTFEPPPAFKPLSQRNIDLKFPAKGAPKYVVGTESGTTTVAYDLKPHDVPQSELGELKDYLAGMFGKAIPGLVWKKNELIELSGRKWVMLEMTSEAVDTEIYNIVLATGYKGQLLMFNFNSTKKDFPNFEKALRDSIASIKVPADESDR